MSDITGNQTVRIRMPVATAAEIDAAKKKGVFGFDTTAGTVAVCPADGANFVRLGLHPADAPAATSLGGTDLVLIVQGGVLKRTTVADLSGGGVWQPLDADLTAIAALATTSFGRSLLTLADAAAARTSIGATSSSDLAGYQPLDSDLTAIAALTTTSFGRSLLAMVDGPAVRAAIGAGTVEPADLASYQPLDADLTAIAALTTNAFGRGLLPLASAAAVRSYIGAGTSSFSGSYTALSSIPASIDAIDGLTPAADRIPYYTGASTGALTALTAFARTLLDDADSATARTTLGAAATVHDHTAITGSAAKLTAARTISATGDASWSVSFDGSANVTASLTLANTITAAGPVGSATTVPIITYDAKGRLTVVSSTTITPAWASVTGKPTTLSGYGIAATDVTAQLLSGFVAGSNTTIAATDSILAAFQKAQGQISARALASDVSTNYLPKLNPTYTGTLTGPVVRAEGDWSSVNGQVVAGKVGQAGYYSMRRGSDGSQTGGIGWMASATESSEFRHSAGGGGSYQTFLNNGVERLRIATDGSLLQSGVAFLDASRNITGTTVKGLNAAGVGIRPVVALADGTFDDQDAAAFRGTIGALASSNPNFTGNLLQDGNQRITADGNGRFVRLVVDSLAAAGLPVVTDEAGVLRNKPVGEFRTIIAAAAADHNHDGVYAPDPAQTDKSGNWTLDADTTKGILQTTTGTLTLPAASATYASKSYIVTASTTLTLTIAGTFCYLDANNNASYWLDTATSVAFTMNGGHASGVRKKIEIWCDGQEWLVRC